MKSKYYYFILGLFLIYSVAVTILKFNLPFSEWISASSTLLASFSAVAVGIIAIGVTQKIEENKLAMEKREKEDKYDGILFAIYSELIAHDKIHNNLLLDIDQFLSYYSETLAILVDNPFREFPLEILKACRLRILDFSKYEPRTLSSISHYTNVIESVQNDLNLKNVRVVTKGLTDKEKSINALNEYFQKIKGTLGKLKKVREDLETSISEIIESVQGDVDGLEKKYNSSLKK